MMERLKFGLIGLLFLFNGRVLGQENVEVQPDVPRGFYLAMTTGQFYFLNGIDRSNYKNGWLVGMKAGYDIFKYVSAEGVFRFSFHDSSQTSPSDIPNSFVGYQVLGQLRGNYPITRRLTVSGDLGGGVWYTNPNISPNVGQAARSMFTFGGGLQYFLRMKGLVMGMDPSFGVVRDLQGAIFQMTGYLRYTF